MATVRNATSKAATAQKIVLNVDTLERGKSYEPFAFGLNGQVVTLTDPADLDWQELASLSADNPLKFFDLCFNAEDKDYFLKQKVEGWKMNMIMDAFLKHYELGSLGNGNGSFI